MQRVEMELARHALAFRPEAGFVFFDKYRRVYRTVYPDYVRSKLNAGQVVESKDFRARLTDIFHALGLRAFGAAAAARRSEDIIGDAAQLTPNSVLLAPGAEWEDKDPQVVAELKRRHGHRMVMVCHDVIPIRFPEYFPLPLATTFRTYFRAAADFVDRFVCVSSRTAQDLENFFRCEALPQPDIQVEPLVGHALSPSEISLPFPEALRSTQFALFVSTIEPRKNHRLLCRVWLRLIERGVVAPTKLKLVLVGREGWQAKELLAEIAAHPNLAGNVIYLQNVSDDILALLYQKSAFFLYPSLYEGFGLPVREALSCGRAVIASNGGALAETLGEFGVCLDPTDENVWCETLTSWITDPQIVAAHEKKVRLDFRQRTWNEVAGRYLQHALDPFPQPLPIEKRAGE